MTRSSGASQDEMVTAIVDLDGGEEDKQEGLVDSLKRFGVGVPLGAHKLFGDITNMLGKGIPAVGIAAGGAIPQRGNREAAPKHLREIFGSANPNFRAMKGVDGFPLDIPGLSPAIPPTETPDFGQVYDALGKSAGGKAITDHINEAKPKIYDMAGIDKADTPLESIVESAARIPAEFTMGALPFGKKGAALFSAMATLNDQFEKMSAGDSNVLKPGIELIADTVVDVNDVTDSVLDYVFDRNTTSLEGRVIPLDVQTASVEQNIFVDENGNPVSRAKINQMALEQSMIDADREYLREKVHAWGATALAGGGIAWLLNGLRKGRINKAPFNNNRLLPSGAAAPQPDQIQLTMQENIVNTFGDELTSMRKALKQQGKSDEDIDLMLAYFERNPRIAAEGAINSGQLGPVKLGVIPREWLAKVAGLNTERVVYTMEEGRTIAMSDRDILQYGLLAMQNKINNSHKAWLNFKNTHPNHPDIPRIDNPASPDFGNPVAMDDILRNTDDVENTFTGFNIEPENQMIRPLAGIGTSVQKAEVDFFAMMLARNQPLKQLATEYAQITDGILQYLVKTKYLDADTAAFWRKEVSSDLFGSIFVPSKNFVDPELTNMQSVGRFLGVDTKSADIMKQVDDIRTRQVATNPVDPGVSLIDTMEDTIRMVHNNAISRSIYRALAHFRTNTSHRGIIGATEQSLKYNPNGATYLGLKNLDDDLDMRQWLLDNKGQFDDTVYRQIVKRTGLKEGHNPESSRHLYNQHIQTVRHNGKQELYFVDNPKVVELLDVAPELYSKTVQVMQGLANIAAKGVTGNPLFVVSQTIPYQQAQMAFNMILGGKANPLSAIYKAPFATVEGLIETSSYGLAKAIANTFTKHDLRSNRAFASMPDAMKNYFEKFLEERLTNSFVALMKNQGNRFATTVFTHSRGLDTLNLVDEVVSGYGNNRNLIRKAVHYYNNAMQVAGEATTVGLAKQLARKTGQTFESADIVANSASKSKALQQAAGETRDILGSVTKLAGSSTVNNVTRTVSFAKVFVESLRTFATQLARNPKTAGAFTVGGGIMYAGFTPMTQGFINAAYNSLQSREQSEWYWNRLTTAQRAGGLYWNIPGRDPASAIIRAVSPDFEGLFHAIGIELFALMTQAQDGKIWDVEELSNPVLDEGSHFLVSIARMFGLPQLVPVSIAMAAEGYRGSLGAQVEGDGFASALIQKAPKGETLSDQQVEGSKYADSMAGGVTIGLMQAMFTTVGAVLIDMFQAGEVGGKDAGVGGFVDEAGSAFTKNMKTLGRFMPTAGAGGLHPSHYDENYDLINKKSDGIQRVVKQFMLSGGKGDMSSDGTRLPAPVRRSNDPIGQAASNFVGPIQKANSEYNQAVSGLKIKISSIRNSTMLYNKETGVAEPRTYEERMTLIDDHVMAIKALHKDHLMYLSEQEALINAEAERIVKRKFLTDFTFESYHPR
jgi:hypothetical protein